MWPFKKKKVIDLTARQIKVPRINAEIYEGDYKDLTSSQTPESALGFLGNLAMSGSDSSSSSSISELSKSSPQHLKVKIEDIEYKITSLRSRIDKIIERLELTEKKIDRLER